MPTQSLHEVIIVVSTLVKFELAKHVVGQDSLTEYTPYKPKFILKL